MSNEKVEGYLINLSLSFEEVAENTWMIIDEEKGLDHVIVMADDPLVIIRVNVMEVPGENREALFERLLRLNSSDLVHGAYAIDENDNIIISDTLVLETMDIEEFQASLDAIGLALAQHYETLSEFRKK
jgi:hypothetical protein